MKKWMIAEVRGKSADTLPKPAANKTHPTGLTGTDCIGLAYQTQAAEQARAALLKRVEEGKKLEEDWMRMYVRRGG